MARYELTVAELAMALAPDGAHPLGHPEGTPVAVVDAHQSPPATMPRLHEGAPMIVAGYRRGHTSPADLPMAPWCDVIVDDDDLDHIEGWAGRHPVASLTAAALLRGADDRGVAEGLLAESATYSTLQAGPEFAAWLAQGSKSAPAPDAGEPVEVQRHDDLLAITLSRPHRGNALNLAMRDGLLAALGVAIHDPTIGRVVIRGAGAHYCTGGDLGEFGGFTDPASAHLVRLQTSIGRALHHLAPRVTVHLHGTCSGSGIELPAFAGEVVATPDVSISLPEVSLGLVPGAGGTVSLPRRIGRHRTAWLALTGRVIDLAAALAWGLVDQEETAS